ncbi:hypothetical protein KR009_009334 [Drosophila setifemur]|nr:hypothetical protein KR009_009334 [Drosophila setifemur]
MQSSDDHHLVTVDTANTAPRLRFQVLPEVTNSTTVATGGDGLVPSCDPDIIANLDNPSPPTTTTPCTSMEIAMANIRLIRVQLPRKEPEGQNSFDRISAGQDYRSPEETHKPQAVTSPRRYDLGSCHSCTPTESNTSPDISGCNSGGAIGGSNASWPDSVSLFRCYGNSAKNCRICDFERAVRRHLQGGLSFKDWLTMKRQQDAKEHRRRVHEAHCLSAMEGLRRQMSEKSYADWLAAKQRQRVHLHDPCSSESALRSFGVGAARYRGGTSTPQLEAEVKRRVDQWLQAKARAQELRLMARQKAQMMDEARAEERRRQSKIAWERWLAQAKGRERQAGRRTSSIGHDPLGCRGRSSNMAVPPSAAQRALRLRLDSIDGKSMHRRPR